MALRRCQRSPRRLRRRSRRRTPAALRARLKPPPLPSPGPLTFVPPTSRLAEIVDLNSIKKAGLRIGFDPFYGAAREYPDRLLEQDGISVATVHNYRDVLFG